MDFELSEEHRLIRDTARRIARERVAPRAAEVDEAAEYPHDIYDVFAEAGFLGLSVPQEYGGSGAGVLALCLATEEVAKYCCASGIILLLSALSTQPILIGGTEEQKKGYPAASARGESKGAFCLTEPNAGSDAANIQSRARLDGDDYVLNGEKCFISGGSVADFVVAFAKTDPTAGARGISGFIDPAGRYQKLARDAAGRTKLTRAVAVDRVCLREGVTPYARHGDILARACLAASALALLTGLIWRRRSSA
jgi:hypothetical protein